MTAPALSLRHLCFTGVQRTSAIVTFGPGLNVISGASETGKSFIFESLDFMLGSGDKLRDIPERRGYDRVFLGLEDATGATFTLERAASGGEFRCYDGLHLAVPENLKPLILAAKHNSTNDENLSTFLLRKCGLAGKRVRKNVAGDTNSLSFRTLAPFALVSEGDIQKQASPIETGQYTSRTVEFSTFKLLLTGVDDSAYQAEKKNQKERLSRTAKIEVIDELIASYRERLSNLAGENDSEVELRFQLVKLDDALSRERELLEQTEEKHRQILVHRNDLRQKSQLVQERRAEIDELLGRFRLLDQHYRSDLERLEGIREAGTLVSALDAQSCPLCGAPAESQNLRHDCDGNIEIVIAAADAENAKIARLRDELRLTTDKLKSEAIAFDRSTPKLRDDLAKAESGYESASPQVSVRRTAYTELVEKRSLVQGAIDILASIAELDARKAKVSGADPAADQKAESFVDLSSATLDEFSVVLESVLKGWNFPDASRVYFDKESRDFVIAGKPRGSRGKGLRAITHAAFTVALLEFTWKKGLPHPGFAVLDTPLLAYREPEGEEDDLTGTDVQERFYEYLSAHDERQVIVLENVDPPASIKNRNQTTIFSKNPHHGRYGFFPTQD